MKKRSITIILLLIIFCSIDLIVAFGPSRERVDRYLDESMTLAAETFVVCSIVNGIVSTIKESSVSASPMGVGVEVEAGQVLDPIDDTVERIANIASTSLVVTGVQKIVFNIIAERITLPFIFLSLAVLILYIIFPAARINVFLIKFFFIILFVRLSIPIMCGIGVWVDNEYIQKDINKNLLALKELVPGSEDTDLTTDIEPKEDKRWYDEIQGYVNNAKSQVIDFYDTLKAISANLFEIMDHFKNIIILLAAKVILQVLLIPLGALWLMRKLFSLIFESGGIITDSILFKPEQSSATSCLGS